MRERNDYAARLIAGHPGRFGIVARLQLPHVRRGIRSFPLGKSNENFFWLLLSFTV